MRLLPLLTLALACGDAPSPVPAGSAPMSADPLRIGWQTTWATQGQLAIALQETDILARHGFDATFTGFSYGGPLNEGALAGGIDVGFTADQPALMLAAASPRFGVVARLMVNRVGLLVPPDSPLRASATASSCAR